jgi:hypothetical protein
MSLWNGPGQGKVKVLPLVLRRRPVTESPYGRTQSILAAPDCAANIFLEILGI